MFNLISRTVDYPLHSLLGFDIHKVSLEPFALLHPSLTLLSELYTTGEPILSISKGLKKKGVTNDAQNIEDIAHDVENLLYRNNYHVQVNPIRVHAINQELNKKISSNNLNVLNSRHVFLENPISSIPVDIYEFIFAVQLKNLVPVINFPEKDTHFTSKSQRLLRLEDRGCVFHIDLLSLSGHNGQEAKKVACALLQNKQVQFVSFQIKALEEIKKNKGIRISRKIANLLDEQLFVSLPQF